MDWNRAMAMRAGAVVIAAGALIAGACSSGTSSSDKTATASANKPPTVAATTAATKAAAPTTAATSAATSAATAGVTTAAGGSATITVATTAIGQVLVNDKGFTLYTFKNDVPGSGKSSVPAALLPNWPPLTATGTATEGAGATGALGTATLDDGTKVVTYKGMPLYTFVNDKAPGDTKGDQLGGIWFAAKP